jgi:hypothetical protein
MTKVRVRRLWIQVLFDVPDKTIPRSEIINTLIRGIHDGSYRYPKAWRVAIKWRNKESAEMRTGEWTAEMRASAESSSGFDVAVENYLKGQRNK